MLILDLETRSRCDLLTAGAYKYAADPSTEIICVGWLLGDESGVFYTHDTIPETVRDYLEGTGLIGAYNAQFDREVWANSGMPYIAFGRWYCVAAQMRVNALPGSLNDAGRALFGKYVKDVRGPQLIKLLSLPQADGEFNTDPTLIKEMGAYCLQDVRATADVMYGCRLMTSKEHNDWLVNEVINTDGVEIDTHLAELAMSYANAEALEIAERMSQLSDGHITKHTQVQRIREWVIPQLDKKAKKLTQVRKKDETKTSLDKNVRAKLLTAAEVGMELDPDVQEMLELLDDGNKSSVAKFKRMVERAETDDRVRGAFVYAGASQTLRYASRGLQLHNFRRDAWSPEETEQWITQMEQDFNAPSMDDLSKMLRPAIVPGDGNVLVVGDWSAIEARALPWLSKDERAEDRLDIFRTGEDLYTRTSNELDLDSRQIGKVAELALGYGGAAGAFYAMAQNYGVYKPEEEVEEIVRLWRGANQWAVDFWNTLEHAAKKAVENPGMDFTAGRVSYRFVRELIGGTLVCTLPDGSAIQYPKCTLVDDELTALKANWKPAAGEKEWPRVGLWRGLLAENVTQATCAALLRDVLRDCYACDLPVIAHVHDEIVVETEYDDRESCKTLLQTLMETARPWATGLPLEAEPTIMMRYGK